MISNYLKLAFRNLIRQKFYAGINIFGLSVGLAVCLLILLFVKDELNYDKYHEKADRIFRVVTQWGQNDSSTKTPINSYRLGPTFKLDYPELENVIRFSPAGGGLVQYENIQYQEQRMFFVDKEVFKVFDFKLMEGEPQTALEEPFTVVLSETTARKYFGDEPAMGKTLRFNDQVDATVTGILHDIPENSHFGIDVLISMETGKQVFFNQLVLNNWGEGSQYTYVLLPEGMGPEKLESRFPEFVEKHIGEGASAGVKLSLQPLGDIHLHSNLSGEIEANSDVRYIYISSAIALFILLIACINYMNLATARSVKRSLEIGVRKTLGAPKGALVGQFLGESILVALLAFLIAYALDSMAISSFNAFVDKNLSLNPMVNPDIFGLFIGITLFVGLIAGSYPAFYLSSFDAIRAFQEKNSSGKSAGMLRKFLVVFQFGISIVLILASMIVFQQWNFLRTKDIGLNKENLVIVPIPDVSQFQSFKNQLEQNPNIINVTATNKQLTGRLSSNLGFKAEQYEPPNPNTRSSIKIVTVDHDFVKTLELGMAEGRDFSREFKSDDSTAFLLNQAAVEMIGWEKPVGKWFETSEFFNGGWKTRRGNIIGVIEDYNHESLYNKIEPAVYFISKGWLSWVSIRISGQNVSSTLADIKEKWVQYASEELYSFTFLDDNIAQLYLTEERFFKLFILFTILAIVIASLGILGLSAFTAEQRTKEIGVRKVFGASPGKLVMLLTKEFTSLVLIGFLIATPIAYWLLENWLQGFTYRIDIGWQPFVLAGILTLVIAWLTAGYQSLKVSLSNPIKALRHQ